MSRLKDENNISISDKDYSNMELLDKYNYDSYNTYIKDIMSQNYKHLTFEEEKELGKKIKEKNKEAVKELVTSNLRLVIKIAKSFIRNGVDFMDLIEIGNQALIEAAWNFDYTKDIKFSTYATSYIVFRLCSERSLYQTGIHLNTYNTVKLSKFLRVYNSFSDDFNGDRLKETIKILNISEEDGIYFLTVSKGNESLNKTINEEISQELINTIPDELNIESQIINKMLVEEIFSSSYINDREKNILRLKYGIGIEKPLTLKEIGKIMNLQFTNISRIEKAALRKIRARYRNVEHLKK